MTKKVYIYSEVKTMIQDQCDIGDEDFVSATELMQFCNDAIDECEAHIHTIYEDYFLSEAFLALVNGTSAYALPTDIYGNKLRYIEYNQNNNSEGTVFEIKRLIDLKKIADIENAYSGVAVPDYRYILTNNLSGSNGVSKIRLIPAAKETSSTNVRLYYLRNANRITGNSSIIDIPEFIQFIVAYMKMRVYEKEGTQRIQVAMADMERTKQLMVETLTQMVDDGQSNVILSDKIYYEELE